VSVRIIRAGLSYLFDILRNFAGPASPGMEIPVLILISEATLKNK
jgi:hypothetical protein